MTSTDVSTQRSVDLKALSLGDVKDIGSVFVQSGMFKDTKTVAQAVTKILAGQELGIPPMQAMNSFHIVDGQPRLSAALVGALVKRSGRYNYRPVETTGKKAIIAWFEAGERVGESSFTLEEAQAAGLTNRANWKTYAADMLFARALTRGARRFCPDVFGGAVYTLGEEVSEDRPEYGTDHVQRVDPPRFVDPLARHDFPPADDEPVEGVEVPQEESLL